MSSGESSPREHRTAAQHRGLLGKLRSARLRDLLHRPSGAGRGRLDQLAQALDRGVHPLRAADRAYHGEFGRRLEPGEPCDLELRDPDRLLDRPAGPRPTAVDRPCPPGRRRRRPAARAPSSPGPETRRAPAGSRGTAACRRMPRGRSPPACPGRSPCGHCRSRRAERRRASPPRAGPDRPLARSRARRTPTMVPMSDALTVSVGAEPLSVDEALAAVADPGAGGTCVFVGTVRDRSPPPATSRASPTRRGTTSRSAGSTEIGEELHGSWPLRPGRDPTPHRLARGRRRQRSDRRERRASSGGVRGVPPGDRAAEAGRPDLEEGGPPFRRGPLGHGELTWDATSRSTSAPRTRSSPGRGRHRVRGADGGGAARDHRRGARDGRRRLADDRRRLGQRHRGPAAARRRDDRVRHHPADDRGGRRAAPRPPGSRVPGSSSASRLTARRSSAGRSRRRCASPARRA